MRSFLILSALTFVVGCDSSGLDIDEPGASVTDDDTAADTAEGETLEGTNGCLTASYTKNDQLAGSTVIHPGDQDVYMGTVTLQNGCETQYGGVTTSDIGMQIAGSIPEYGDSFNVGFYHQHILVCHLQKSGEEYLRYSLTTIVPGLYEMESPIWVPDHDVVEFNFTCSFTHDSPEPDSGVLAFAADIGWVSATNGPDYSAFNLGTTNEFPTEAFMWFDGPPFQLLLVGSN